MVDIHCHILPGLDDGADTLETSIQMAESAIADGITHVVGTPHANSHYVFDPEIIRQRRDELPARGIRGVFHPAVHGRDHAPSATYRIVAHRNASRAERDVANEA